MLDLSTQTASINYSCDDWKMVLTGIQTSIIMNSIRNIFFWWSDSFYFWFFENGKIAWPFTILDQNTTWLVSLFAIEILVMKKKTTVHCRFLHIISPNTRNYRSLPTWIEVSRNTQSWHCWHLIEKHLFHISLQTLQILVQNRLKLMPN